MDFGHYTARDAVLTRAAMYIAGDSGVNFSKKFKLCHNFPQIFNGDWITSVCACM